MDDQMARRRRRRRLKKQQRLRRMRNTLLVAILILAAVLGLLIWQLNRVQAPSPGADPDQPPATSQAQSAADSQTRPAETTRATAPPTTQPPTTLPEATHAVSTATILSTGDLLIHGQLITDAKIGEDQYDFSYIFPYARSYVSAADYAVANLETTLAGTARAYSGNPMFNCPDNIVQSAKDAGFDMLLTANNHSYDSGQPGYDRTIQIVREMGLANLGTMLSADEPKYTIVDINGIRVGMICYTYEDSQSKGAYPYLNYNPMTGGSYDIINCFRKTDPSSMYTEIAAYLAAMKAEGAEATVLYIHWGEEYYLSPTAQQTQIAQKLCDLGIDVIIGGHPHVVEPMALLTSTTDPDHKTVCLYSMGNTVSNQRLGLISSIATAHTEDGVFFNITFTKYSDGSVYLEDAEITPIWVRAIDMNGNTVVRQSGTIKSYVILPLDDSCRDLWQTRFGLNDSTLQQCVESWQRTMDLVSPGLTEIRNYLQQAKNDRLAQYQAEIA